MTTIQEKELEEAILVFLNESLQNLPNKLKSINDLKDPNLLEIILKEIEENFFKNINLLPNESESNRIYNMSLIYQRIENYYEYIIKNKLNDYFNPKDSSEKNYLNLASLIVGLCAQCSQRENFLNIMNNLSDNYSNSLMQILLELIPVDNKDKSEGSIENSEKSNEDNKENENAMLWIRAENAEKEVDRLNNEITELTNKNVELTRQNYAYELEIKETEAKYQELVLSLEKRELDNNEKNNEQYDTNINLNIQLSELKGKYEAKEKSFNEYREEKERTIEELKTQIFNMKKENAILKENSVKYEILNQQMKKFSMEDMYSIKQKLIISERQNKEKEEEIKRLKNIDDRQLLLKKIEELNEKLFLNMEKNKEIISENESYRMKIVKIERENALLKENNNENNNKDNLLNDINEQNNSENIKEKTRGVSLENIMEEENVKSKILELETKTDILQNDKNNLQKEKTSLVNEINTYKKQINEQKDTIEKISKKLEKYSNLKKENQTFISKITDLMDKLDEVKNENLNVKNEKIETEKKLNEEINRLSNLLNESNLKSKDLENQMKMVEKENSKFDEINKSNKLVLANLERRSSLPIDFGKFEEIEKKLQVLTEKEGSELKKKIKEKDELLKKYSEKLKKVEAEFKELNMRNSKVPMELQKRDEAIEYYKNQHDLKDKLYNEELKLLSSIFHKLNFEKLSVKYKKNLDNIKDN
jgi:hypothetical protein